MQVNNAIDSFVGDENEEANNALFFQKIIQKFLALWPWLILSIVICVSIAYLYMKFSSPVYKVNASILVQDDKKGTDLGEAGILQDFGLLLGKSNVDNEVEIFKSRTLMEQVVDDLQLNVHYFVEGKVRKHEIFSIRPLSLNFIKWNSVNDKDPLVYEINISKDKSKISLLANDKKTDVAIGDTIHLREGMAVVTAENGFNKWDVEETIYVSVNTASGETNRYMNALTVQVPNTFVSVIDLSLNETLPEKGEVILNTLINAYLQANVTDKGRMADSTVKFIDERLKLVFVELSDIEKEIEGFKTTNKLTDLSEQAKILLQNASEYAKQQAAQEVELSIVEALETFLKNNINDEKVVPSSLVMQDPNFLVLIQRYNDLQLQRAKMLMSQTANHPAVVNLNEQLKSLRLNLLSSVGSIKAGIKVAIGEIKNRAKAFEAQTSTVPKKERLFLDFSRQQAIKQELYLFLLKKREETAISKSSTIASARVIDSAKSDTFPFKPKRNMILLVGLLMGIVIPFSISYARDLFNNRLSTTDDITNITKTPILAEIGHNIDDSAIAVTMHARSLIAEQFRSLRTNLNFLLTGEEQKVILITSSMSGEGKSFLSVNLSAALALAGKKVILLELDLRKPKISENLKLKQEGFTNYIVSGARGEWKNLIQQSSLVQQGFDVLSSGPLPPNPAELLMLPKMGALIEEFKAVYDYIIIDSAPIGLVTDAQILAAMSDITLYVVRHSLTYKSQVRLIDKLYRKNALPRLNIVINDVAARKAGYGYGYGYGYSAYGYGVYGEDTKKK